MREGERERSSQAERELAVWWPCITHVGAALNAGLGVCFSSGVLPSPSARCRGSVASKPGREREDSRAGAATAQAPAEESGTKERFRKRRPRKHVSDTHTQTHRGRRNPWTCSASSGCGETGELFLVP